MDAPICPECKQPMKAVDVDDRPLAGGGSDGVPAEWRCVTVGCPLVGRDER